MQRQAWRQDSVTREGYKQLLGEHKHFNFLNSRVWTTETKVFSTKFDTILGKDLKKDLQVKIKRISTNSGVGAIFHEI